MGMSIQEYRNLVLNEPKKSPYRQLQGKINHELGKNFEEQIEAICSVYELNNLAKIEKTPEPLKVLRSYSKRTF